MSGTKAPLVRAADDTSFTRCQNSPCLKALSRGTLLLIVWEERGQEREVRVEVEVEVEC